MRKGGIGEKRFELPHPRFYLFPTYAHQRPELVKAEGRARFADPLAQREEPDAPAARRSTPSCTRPTRSPTPTRSRRSTTCTSSRPPTPRSACAGGASTRCGPPCCACGRVPEPPVLDVTRRARRLRELGGPARVDRRARATRCRRSSDEAFARAAGDVEAALAAAGVDRVTRAHVLVCRGPDCTSRGSHGRLHGDGRRSAPPRGSATRSSRARAAASARSAAAARWCAATRPGPGTRRSRPPTSPRSCASDLTEGRVVERLEAGRLEGAA